MNDIHKIVKKETNLLTVIGLSSFFSMSLYVIFGIVRGFFPMSISDFFLIFFIPALLLLALELYIIDCIVWQLMGYEEICVNSQEIILRRKRKIFSENVKIRLETVESIFVTDYEQIFPEQGVIITRPSEFAKHTGESGGKICIKYANVSIDFGQSLTTKEAVELVSEITQYMQTKNIIYVEEQQSKSVKFINKIIKRINGSPSPA